MGRVPQPPEPPRQPSVTALLHPSDLPDCWRAATQQVQPREEQKAAFFQVFSAAKCDSFFQHSHYRICHRRNDSSASPQRRATAAGELRPASFLGDRWVPSFPLTAQRCFQAAPTPRCAPSPCHEHGGLSAADPQHIAPPAAHRGFPAHPSRAVPPCVRRSRAEAEAAAPRPGGGGGRC